MKLRKTFAFLSIVALMTLPVAAMGEGKDVTVKGEVLDLACYMAHDDGHGSEHAACAVKCVKGGQPVGLKAEDGTVYVLFADHGDASAYDKTKDYAGKMVEISGSMFDKAGMKGITVNGVKEI